MSIDMRGIHIKNVLCESLIVVVYIVVFTSLG